MMFKHGDLATAAHPAHRQQGHAQLLFSRQRAGRHDRPPLGAHLADVPSEDRVRRAAADQKGHREPGTDQFGTKEIQ